MLKAIIFSITFALIPQLSFAVVPYSVHWMDLAKRQLDADEIERALFIMRGAEWYSTHMDPEGVDGPEPEKANIKPSDELHLLLEEAKLGHASANEVLMFLLEASRPQKELKKYHRGHAVYGTMVLSPYTKRNSINLAQRFIADEVRKSPENFETALKSLIRLALLDVNSISKAESVVAFMSNEAIADQVGQIPEARDFLLLMTAHPVPSVRMMAHLGLSPFVRKDPEIREFLLATSANKPKDIYTRAEYNYVESVLEFVEAQNHLVVGLSDWKEIYQTKIKNWRSQQRRSRLTDLGDYNVERMANASAAQAFLVAAYSPLLGEGRDVILQYDRGIKPVVEAFALNQRQPVIRALDVGNGTGFGAYSYVNFAGTLRMKTVVAPEILVEARPNNMWALMAVPHVKLIALFDRLVSQPLQIHHGHLDSVLGRLMYGVLKLPPPDYFHKELENFQEKLARHYRLSVKEMQNMPEVFIAKNVGDFSGYLLRLGARLSDPTQLKEKALSQPLTESVFVRPLGEIYAIRALALMGQEELARELLIKKLPKTWELSRQEQRDLGKSMMNYRLNDDDTGLLRTADLSEAGKIQSLQILFESFEFAWPAQDARGEILSWLAELKDEKLAHAGLAILKASNTSSCEVLLK